MGYGGASYLTLVIVAGISIIGVRLFLMSEQCQNLEPYQASVILPVMNETFSLRQTVETLESACSQWVFEYLVVYCDHTTNESMEVIKELGRVYGAKVVKVKQELPFLGGAIRDAFSRAKGSHVVMMASDLETEPKDLQRMLQLSEGNSAAIITASRWVGEGFTGYNPLKWALNFFFQKIFGVLYRTKLSDLTYGYRVFPTSLVRSIQWEELRHPFLFETIVKPLRMGIEVLEVPTRWRSREEGESQNTFFRNFEYFRIGFRVLFSKPEHWGVKA